MSVAKHDRALARSLVGRKIVAAKPNRFESCNAGVKRDDDDYWAHDWVIVLDDRSELHFYVEETETGEYGIDIIRRRSDVP